MVLNDNSAARNCSRKIVPEDQRKSVEVQERTWTCVLWRWTWPWPIK